MQHLYFVALGLQRLWPALPSVWQVTGCKATSHTHVHLEMLQLLAKNRKENATPFGVNLLRSQASYQAAQELLAMSCSVI